MAMATLSAAAVMPGRVLADSGFAGWLSGFAAQARAAGVSDAALKALGRAEYLPSVIKSDRRPAETARSLQDYISSAASPQRSTPSRAQTHTCLTFMTSLAASTTCPPSTS